MVDVQKIVEKDKPSPNFGAGSHRLRVVDLFRLSLRVFRVRPLRTFLTIFGISLGIGTVLFLVSLGYGLQYILIGKLAATEDSLITLEAYYPTENNLVIQASDLDQIAALPGADELSPVGEFAAEAKNGEISGFLTAKITTPNYFRLSGTKADIGSTFTEGQEAVIISNTALKLLNFPQDETSIGKEITFKVYYSGEAGNEQNASTTVVAPSGPLKIVGILNDENQPPYIIVSSKLLSKDPPYYQTLYVKAKDINTVETVRDELFKKGFLISAKLDLVNQAQKIMTIITVVLGIFGVAALVVSAIGMFNTMIIGFMERIFEVGIMKSIGATVADIRNLFLMESLIMGLMGGAGGIALGVLGGQLFNLGLNILARYLGGQPINLFIYPVQFIAFIIGISGFVGILSGFWPARRAAQLSPKQAFKTK